MALAAHPHGGFLRCIEDSARLEIRRGRHNSERSAPVSGLHLPLPVMGLCRTHHNQGWISDSNIHEIVEMHLSGEAVSNLLANDEGELVKDKPLTWRR